MGPDKNKYDKYENYKSSWIKIDNGDLELIEPISVKRFVFPNDNGFYIEILLNNKIVGSFHCYYDEDEGQMNDIEILPEYRNIGLGKILLLKAIELSNDIFGGFSSDVRGLTKEQEQVYRSLNKDGALVNWSEINYKRAQEVIDLISEKLNNNMNLQESIKRIIREETEYVKDVRVKISDILKTNSDGQSLDDAIVNVQDGLKSYSEGPPFLLKIGDKYEILDGFHRIAKRILDGKKYIISDVMIKESNMNLQENIKRILRENMNVRLYLLRRYGYDELNNILQNSLQIQSRNLKHYKDKTFNNFNNAVVRSITERIGEELTDGWIEESPIPENEIYDFVESFFKDEIIKKYDDLILNNINLQESIKRIIREETELPLYMRRRLTKVENLFNKIIKDINIYEFDDLDDFHNSIVHDITEELCSDLDSYNLFYEHIDKILTSKTKKAWKKHKKK